MFIFLILGFCMNLFIHTIMANPLGGLKNVMEIMKNSLKETEKSLKENEKYVNTKEVEEVKELLEKYGIVIKDNIDEKELILKYETFYDQLNEVVINKRKEIVDVEGIINDLSGIENVGNFSTIGNKKENTNQIIDCVNRIVERIRELETTIYKNRMNELDNMKTERYGESKQVEVQQPIKVVDNEMDIINNSMNVLKQWSNKNTSNILFDSKVDGNGSKNVLHNRVLNKSNLYFITSDTNNNVFGGYVNVKINKSNDFITDINAFVFSLIRDGNVKNTKYSIRPDCSMCAFALYNNHLHGWLYKFGYDDIRVHRICVNESYCECAYYKCNDEQDPLIDITTHSTNFEAKRIVVIEMN